MLSKKIGLFVGVFALVSLTFASGAQAFSLPIPGPWNHQDGQGENQGGVKADLEGSEGTGASWPGGMMRGMRFGQGITGMVTAISGNIITVNGRHASTTATFIVDASNATVLKNKATSTLASIAVNDTVFVQGTVSGTSVTATMIFDGKVPPQGPKPKVPGAGMMKGRLDLHGTVTAVSGSTLTVNGVWATSTAPSTFTVDASNAVVVKNNATSTTLGITTGDNVIVIGPLTGTTITATLIYDGAIPMKANGKGNEGGAPSFLQKIGGFLMNLFHFGK